MRIQRLKVEGCSCTKWLLKLYLYKHHSTVFKIAYLICPYVLHSCNDEYDIVPTCTYTLQGGGLRPNTPNASKCRGMFYLEYISKHF